MEYTSEKYTTDIAVEDFIAQFRDERRFIGFCRECPNFGNSWGCPPFDFDTDNLLHQYKYAHIIATKIIPESKDISIDKVQVLIRSERINLERHLLALESRYDGRAFSFVGECLYCGDIPCARRSGLPCRHPDKVRPSLEAFGFDIGRTLGEFFGIELLWGKDGQLPHYIMLVSALLHNSPLDEFVN